MLFLDEPTTGLDPGGARGDVGGDRPADASRSGLTILLTTHYLEEADELAAQLAIVDRGRVVAAGTPDELKGELEGDALHVELADAPADGEVRRALERVPGLREVARRRAQLRARADDGAPRRARRCSPRSRARGARVAALTLSRPSLDDVYLRVAGRAFGEADSEQSEEAPHERRPPQLAHHAALPARAHPPARWVAITLVQPVIWLLLFGALFKSVSRSPASRAAATSTTSRRASSS